MSSPSEIDRYGLTLSDVESSDTEDQEVIQEKTFTPKQLLSLAIGKRWKLAKNDGKDLRSEILQTQLIVRLCRFVQGEADKRKRAMSNQGDYTEPLVTKKFKKNDE